VIAVSAITLLLILGAIITPYNIVFAKKHSNGGNNNGGNTNGNDQKQKDDPNNGSNPPPDQTTNSGDQPATDQTTNSGDQPPSSDGNPPPPPPVQLLLPVNPPASEVDCSKTPDDPTCQPKSTPPKVDCIANPTDPLCPPPTPGLKQENNTSSAQKAAAPALVPAAITPKPKGPDIRCLFFPELPNCGPDKDGKCPANFFTNGDGQCVPNKKCPPGFENHDNDESGTCWPKNKNSPSIICPPGVNPPYCVTDCRAGQHPNQFFICVKNNIIVIHKTVKKVVHITSNNDQNSMVTRNTKITDQLTVGQAIDGCKDLTKKSPDNALKKSCNIMMAAAFNYCMTHTKLWLTDSNLCSDNLYLKNVQRYIAENVNLKFFPATIYNVRP
jgi:hypothetical protein